GLVSRYGMIAFASSLDQGGPMAKSAEDLAILLEAMVGFDPNDSTSLERPAVDYSNTISDSIAGLRIGIPKEYFSDQIAPDVQTSIAQALTEYQKLGATLVDISLPTSPLSVAAYYVIAPAEASSNLSRFDGVRYGYRAPEYKDLTEMYSKTRAQGFGAEVRRRILIGTYVLSHGYYDAYYIKAQKVRRLISEDFARAFSSCDVIMSPTTPSTAFKLGEKVSDPVQMYLSDTFTIAANLAGLPAMSIPCGLDKNNLPVGLQLIGNYFDEARMIAAAHQYQLATDWHLKKPPLSIA
ncbi:MAG: Asp-tRNA(Asn)/Glu-tRNA(Gln) amidotransferase subunit GatA, partial [Betaproteobacteria bacterium]|nr:Asp-tRNA(Asn)/Glu-tRNA(Gln) amidotransferase subunit GatA [Betaproteobacteria bacterium]